VCAPGVNASDGRNDASAREPNTSARSQAGNAPNSRPTPWSSSAQAGSLPWSCLGLGDSHRFAMASALSARYALHLAPILARAPAQKLHPQPPRPLAPEAFERPQLPPLLAAGFLRAGQPGTTLGFHRRNLLAHQLVRRIHPPSTPPPATRNGRALPQPHRLPWFGHLAQARQA
jgi:hypothetical protein